jgi:very-short-patch-repair endonuclease
MKEYLSYRSAAEQYRIPSFDVVLAHTKSGLSQNDSIPREVTFRGHAKRFFASETRNHSSQLALPKGAIVTKGGVAVASPELVFLQMATVLDMQRLILFGLQLCAHPPGKPGEAVSSQRKINAFLAKTHGHAGHRNAVRAAKLLEDGSGSVMESLAFMVLSLPHALGGYGLGGAVFNREITLDKQSGRRLSQKRFFVDIYYEKSKLAIEYQSLAHHATAAKQGKDMVRANILERLGVQMMSLSTIQLYSVDDTRNFAFNIAARLGRRIQIRTVRFPNMHAELRKLFPSGSPEVQPEQQV